MKIYVFHLLIVIPADPPHTPSATTTLKMAVLYDVTLSTLPAIV